MRSLSCFSEHPETGKTTCFEILYSVSSCVEMKLGYFVASLLYIYIIFIDHKEKNIKTQILLQSMPIAGKAKTKTWSVPSYSPSSAIPEARSAEWCAAWREPLRGPQPKLGRRPLPAPLTDNISTLAMIWLVLLWKVAQTFYTYSGLGMALRES